MVKTVEELIAALKEYPGNTPVMVAKDSEGNRFQPLANVSIYFFDKQDEIADEFDYDNRTDLTLKLVIWP